MHLSKPPYLQLPLNNRTATNLCAIRVIAQESASACTKKNTLEKTCTDLFPKPAASISAHYHAGAAKLSVAFAQMFYCKVNDSYLFFFNMYT